MSIFGILVAILIISFLVFFHEGGHFLVARMLGVRVDVFSIGFGKKIWQKKYKNTVYCISAIPLGGYVQMKGQDDSDPTITSDDPDSYSAKKPFEKILILLAGPFANILLAFLIYIVIAFLGVSEISPIVGKVHENSAAYNKLQKDDIILKINNQKIYNWDDIKPIVQESNGLLFIEIKRNDKIKQIALEPRIQNSKNIFQEDIKEKLIGISSSNKTFIAFYKGTNSIKYAYEKSIESSKMIFLGFEKLISGVISPKEMGGPIAIVDLTSKVMSYGIVPLLLFTALISINLGILNLLPIPVLDGGHIMFNLYELIFRRKATQKVFITLNYIGMALLISLMIFTTINDTVRIFSETDIKLDRK